MRLMGGDRDRWRPPSRASGPPDRRGSRPARTGDGTAPVVRDGWTVRHGIHPVMEALAAGVVVEVIAAAPDRAQVAPVIRRAAHLKVPVREVLPGDLDRETGGARHQGVAAVVRPFAYLSFDDLRVRVAGATGDPLLVALDGVEDPQNFGAVLRSAEGAGALAVIVAERGSSPVSAAVARASAGAVDRVPVVRVPSLSTTLIALKQDGFDVVGLDGEATAAYDEAIARGRLVLVAGSEGRGLGRPARMACDRLVRIPLLGEIASLNVSVAVAVVAFAARSARRQGTALAESGADVDAEPPAGPPVD